jgi:hypothetical protein
MDVTSTGPTCDRCGAAAKVADVRGASVWRWCDHHGREYAAILKDAGFERVTLAMLHLRDVGSSTEHGG